ncbi:quinolinate synthase NadA [candidate division CSSED10-310 bacterium]|uniref:Quinolinate synthase n=1 Tax=candidate division CSSED10-310 bacterium TaxID=2855610 RepID=A0ABV6YWB7_UNCC1
MIEKLTTKELINKITSLKLEKNAVILAHNYQLAEIQDIADFVGDSLELAKKAATTAAEVIVFCGVHFMAETAKILNPEKLVLLPDSGAGCPMADMISAPELNTIKRQFPEAAVVCYVNSSAEVKAVSDVCCTSANSVKIVNKLDQASVYFVPDQYLAQYTARFTDKIIAYWPGFCPTHDRINAADVALKRHEFPDAEVLVHPECKPEVIDAADFVFSTGGMVRHARDSKNRQMIIGTEIGIIHRLKKENPDKQFIPINEQAICPYMKLIRLTTLLQALENNLYPIEIDPDTLNKAKYAVNRMVQ